MLSKIKDLLVKYKSSLKLVGVLLTLLLASKGLQSFARVYFNEGRVEACNKTSALFIPPMAGAFCQVDEDDQLVIVISALGRTFNVETGEEVLK